MNEIPVLPALIAGGGFCGCGAAAAIPGSLLVDENNVPGGDFTLSLAPCDLCRMPRHPKAVRFYQQLKERNAWTADGILRTAALAPELAAWLLEEKVRILLGAVVEPAETPGEFRIFSVEGERRVRTPRFLDLRVKTPQKKFWHILVSSSVTGDFDHFTLRKAPQVGCALLSLSLNGNCSWSKARKQLREVWHNRPAELQAAKIIWSAPVFDFHVFSDPVQALDCGLHQEF